VRRREFIALVGGAAAWPCAARAQQRDLRKIGVLMGAQPSVLGETYLNAFTKRLEELGWSGRNAKLDVRWWAGGPG
jgi:putative ABC transport system substrate-binding protein